MPNSKKYKKQYSEFREGKGIRSNTFILLIYLAIPYFSVTAQQVTPKPISCLNLIKQSNLNSQMQPDSVKHIPANIDEPTIDAAWFVPNATPCLVGKYQKMELGFKLPELIQKKVDDFLKGIHPENQLNPYDPDLLDVRITLQSPSNQQYIKPAFYYEPYENLGGTYTKQNTDFSFRFRFAPDELGTWKLSVSVVMPNETINGNYVITFVCVPSNHNGYLVKGNYGDERDRYLYFKENKTTFKGIGMNITHSTYDDNWTSTELAQHKTWIQNFANNGGNFLRLELGAQNALPDWIEFNNYTPRMKHMQMFDELIELAEEKDIYFMLFRHHVEVLKDGPEWDHVSWVENPYKKAFHLTQRIDFFTHQEVIKWQKHCLRYIMARWGYSSNMSVYEYSELDLFIPESEGRGDIFDKPLKSTEQTSIRDWLAQMAFTTKRHNPNLFFTITFTQGKSPSRLKELYELPKKTSYDFNHVVDLVGFHQYHDERKYTNYEDRFEQTDKLWKYFNKPVICEEIGFSDDPTNLIYCCEPYEFKNNVWATFMMGNMSSGMHWWWDRGIFKTGHEQYFQYLKNFLSTENLEGYSYKPNKWKDGSIDKMKIENYYLLSNQKESVLGWVHNATYRWRNLFNTSNCIQKMVANTSDYSCICEDGHLLVSGTFNYNKPEYIDYYQNDVSDVLNETFLIEGLKKTTSSTLKHWYQIDFYHTQGVLPENMFSHTLVMPTNRRGRLKLPITLYALAPDYAYKISYLGYHKNKPNVQLTGNEK
ncbi:MAG: DUF5060 domain-containing protein [Flavobacteriales bacterium]|nr:DUF5060 domain-containing protein [Flavobacteriales bacterium]